MQVHGIVWAGTRTEAFGPTLAFFRDVLGVPFVEAQPGFAWARLPDGSMLEVFGPGGPDVDEFDTGPVVEFLVDDLAAALDELRAAGVEVLGTPNLGGEVGWLHFRGPDGNVYGLTSGPDYRR